MKFNPPYNDPNKEYFQDSELNGYNGDIVPAKLINDLQMEIVNAILAAQLTPNANSTTQLAEAINAKAYVNTRMVIDQDVLPRVTAIETSLYTDLRPRVVRAEDRINKELLPKITANETEIIELWRHVGKLENTVNVIHKEKFDDIDEEFENLKAELNKVAQMADDSVKRQGDTMTGDLFMKNGTPRIWLTEKNVTYNILPASSTDGIFGFQSVDGRTLAAISHYIQTNGTSTVSLDARGFTTASSNTTGAISISVATNGTITTSTPTPPASDSSTQIPTTAWVRTTVASIMATTNALSATRLQTARTFITNLASTAAASFNGTANVSPGVTGILAIANGGTGANNATTARTNLGTVAKAGDTFTGAVYKPNPPATENSTRIATTAWVRTHVTTELNTFKTKIENGEIGGTSVVQAPVIVNLADNSPNVMPVTFTVKSSSLALTPVNISYFLYSVPLANITDAKVTASNNQASISFNIPTTVAVGTTLRIGVVAVDASGRRSSQTLGLTVVRSDMVTTPTLSSPTANAQFTKTGTISMKSSAFAIRSASGGTASITDTHSRSQWQIRNTSGTVIYDSGEVTSLTTINILTASYSGLVVNTNYVCYVRHKGTKLGWSNWSAGVTIKIIDRVQYSEKQAYLTAGNYTFTVPTGINSIKVLVVGAGATGETIANKSAYNTYTTLAGGRGGKGGGIASATIAVTAGTSIAVKVGAIGTTGGTSSFGTYVQATGGSLTTRGAATIQNATTICNLSSTPANKFCHTLENMRDNAWSSSLTLAELLSAMGISAIPTTVQAAVNTAAAITACTAGTAGTGTSPGAGGLPSGTTGGTGGVGGTNGSGGNGGTGTGTGGKGGDSGSGSGNGGNGGNGKVTGGAGGAAKGAGTGGSGGTGGTGAGGAGGASATGNGGAGGHGKGNGGAGGAITGHGKVGGTGGSSISSSGGAGGAGNSQNSNATSTKPPTTISGGGKGGDGFGGNGGAGGNVSNMIYGSGGAGGNGLNTGGRGGNGGLNTHANGTTLTLPYKGGDGGIGCVGGKGGDGGYVYATTWLSNTGVTTNQRNAAALVPVKGGGNGGKGANGGAGGNGGNNGFASKEHYFHYGSDGGDGGSATIGYGGSGGNGGNGGNGSGHSGCGAAATIPYAGVGGNGGNGAIGGNGGNGGASGSMVVVASDFVSLQIAGKGGNGGPGCVVVWW